MGHTVKIITAAKYAADSRWKHDLHNASTNVDSETRVRWTRDFCATSRSFPDAVPICQFAELALAISRTGGVPNSLLYSRLNCEELS